jgi:DNA-binding CsgD family transcriptional regulator
MAARIKEIARLRAAGFRNAEIADVLDIKHAV